MEINLNNLTKTRRDARQKEFAMRVNARTPAHTLPVTTNKASKRNREIYGPYSERERPANEALPRTFVSGSGPYDGSELRPFSGRPGANDFLAIKSVGIDA